MRPSSRSATIGATTRPTAAGDEGDIMRKAIFELWLAWQLTFGGSGVLLRRA